MKFLRSRPQTVKLPPRIKYQTAREATPGLSLSGQGQQSTATTIHVSRENKRAQDTNKSVSLNSQQTKIKEIETKKKNLNEIDDIFASSKKTPSASASSTTKSRQASQTPIEPNLQIESTYGIIKSANVQIFSPEAPLERIDKATGLPVYKAHLLKVGEGGGTPLCPFACDCCF
jgi:hypothetical protein